MKKYAILGLILVLFTPLVSSAHTACEAGDLFNIDTGARCAPIPCQAGDLYDSQTGELCSLEQSVAPTQPTEPVAGDTSPTNPAPTCTLNATTTLLNVADQQADGTYFIPVGMITWTSDNATSVQYQRQTPYHSLATFDASSIFPISGGELNDLNLDPTYSSQIILTFTGPGGVAECSATLPHGVEVQ